MCGFKFGCVFLVGLAVLSEMSVAESLIFACTFRDGSASYNYMAQADQLVVDVEKQSADLRVARTMGTGTPVNWLFSTREVWGGPDKFLVYVGENWIAGAGFLAGTPHSFQLEDSLLTWTFVIAEGPVWLRWECKG
jgi:hypothetical protein